MYDTVVVGARDRNSFADAKLRQGGGRHRLVFSRIFNRAGRDNRTLAGHQTRIRRCRAYRAGICERDRCSLKIGDLEFAIAGLFDLLIVSCEKRGKIHRVRAFDVWHKQVSRAVFFFDVDGDTEIYIFVFEP